MIIKICISILFIFSISIYADCEILLDKYENIPDPTLKTMKQLKRWIKRKVKKEDVEMIEKCLILRAADNPKSKKVTEMYGDIL